MIWEKSPFKDSRMASISWAFVITTPCPMIPQVKHPSTAEPHDTLLVSFGRWSSGHSDRPRTSGPSDDGLKFGQFARIIQACGDLVACEIGKFRDNVFSCFASCQVPEHKANWNTRSL